MYASIFIIAFGLQALAAQAHPYLHSRVDKDPSQLGALPTQYLVSDPTIPNNGQLHLYSVYGPSVIYFWGNSIDPNSVSGQPHSIPFLMGAVFPCPENGTDNQVIIDMIVQNLGLLKVANFKPTVTKAWFAQIVDNARHVEDGTNTTIPEHLNAALAAVDVYFPAEFPATPYLVGSPLNPLSNLSASYDAVGAPIADINGILSVVTDV